jgi:prevent-host-death family protein
MKNKYSIYEAKTHLSEILRQVKQNRSVIITDRGKEVARVVPLEEKTSFEKRIEAFERSGVIQYSPDTNPAEIRPIKHCPGALKEFLETRNRY